LPEVPSQKIKINVFYRDYEVIITILSRPTFCLADTDPIRCLVASTFETVTLNERLHHMNGVAVFMHPVLFNTSQDTGENITCKVRNMDPRQQEKTGIVSYGAYVGFADLWAPANKVITGSCFPSSRTEKKTSKITSEFIPDEEL
jgi:hypothetical protein